MNQSPSCVISVDYMGIIQPIRNRLGKLMQIWITLHHSLCNLLDPVWLKSLTKIQRKLGLLLPKRLWIEFKKDLLRTKANSLVETNLLLLTSLLQAIFFLIS